MTVVSVEVTDYNPPTDSSAANVCGQCRHDPMAVWFPILNSRTGKYHSGGEYGITHCGRDATRDWWLWPL